MLVEMKKNEHGKFAPHTKAQLKPIVQQAMRNDEDVRCHENGPSVQESFLRAAASGHNPQIKTEAE